MKVKNIGKRNRTRGHNYERQICNEFKELGFAAETSRYASRKTDDMKVDLCGTEPFNIQCKAKDTCVNYQQVLSEMPKDTNYNLIFSKVTGKGEFVIMSKSDFIDLLKGMKREGVIVPKI